MCAKISTTPIGLVLGYTFPRLHEGKHNYVDFQAIDPETRKLKRKKYYVSGRNKREMRATAAMLIEKLNSKLRNGWTPWAQSDSRGAKLLEEVLEKYLVSVEKSTRKSSTDNYRSRVNVLREYISTLSAPPMYAMHYDRAFVSDFLDWTVEKRCVNARTRNNYRAWCFGLGAFMVERGYLPENPVAGIKAMRTVRKSRQPLTEEMLHELFRYLHATDRHFLLACMMEYYTFIRPNELRHIRIRDISVKDQTVFVPAEVSKNRMDGKVSLNEDIIRLMLELRVLERPSGLYLFGKKFMPSPDMADSDMFNKHWHKVRKILKWPDEIKFYSLKDSGIRDLSNSAGVVTARDQARHQDISTTNKYLQGRDCQAPEAAKHFKGALN